ncbi:hypothetical protein ABT317_19935 [Streptomyces carpinensis]|uniref:Dehydrogenase n=1 Tax=Streptomyces carpinensis TaxID=66369 RepID=A0ABV1W4T1_9ACTN
MALLRRRCAGAEAGALPRRPHGRGGSAGLDVSAGWSDNRLVAAYVERVLGRIESHAPGLRAVVTRWSAVSPAEIAAANLNAVHGDPYGGSAEFDQNLIWRPGPSMSRHRTAVPGLWHIGASTHPGPGLSGGSGHLVARQLLGRAAHLRG